MSHAHRSELSNHTTNVKFPAWRTVPGRLRGPLHGSRLDNLVVLSTALPFDPGRPRCFTGSRWSGTGQRNTRLGLRRLPAHRRGARRPVSGPPPDVRGLGGPSSSPSGSASPRRRWPRRTNALNRRPGACRGLGAPRSSPPPHPQRCSPTPSPPGSRGPWRIGRPGSGISGSLGCPRVGPGPSAARIPPRASPGNLDLLDQRADRPRPDPRPRLRSLKESRGPPTPTWTCAGSPSSGSACFSLVFAIVRGNELGMDEPSPSSPASPPASSCSPRFLWWGGPLARSRCWPLRFFSAGRAFLGHERRVVRHVLRRLRVDLLPVAVLPDGAGLLAAGSRGCARLAVDGDADGPSPRSPAWFSDRLRGRAPSWSAGLAPAGGRGPGGSPSIAAVRHTAYADFHPRLRARRAAGMGPGLSRRRPNGRILSVGAAPARPARRRARPTRSASLGRAVMGRRRAGQRVLRVAGGYASPQDYVGRG